MKDVEYIVNHAEKLSKDKLVMFGMVDSEGQKMARYLKTNLFGQTAQTFGDEIFASNEVEQNVSFPGGQQGLLTAIAQAIRYPEIAAENGTQGTVMVRFIVEKDGRITNPQVTKSVSTALDKEALRAVSSLGRMSRSAKINGIPVRSYFSVPVAFRLSR